MRSRSLLRQLTRGQVLSGPSTRGFVTSTRLWNANANAPSQLEIASKSEDVKADSLNIPITCMSKGSALHLRGPRAKLTLNYTFLRDLCKCPQCVDPHSKQKSFRTNDIPLDIRPRNIKWDGEHLEVQWVNDTQGASPDHLSRWHLQYLRNPSIKPNHSSPRFSPLLWNAGQMKEQQHWVSYEDYMNNEDKFAASMRNLQRLGLIFIKDIPDSREEVAKIATRIGPLRNSFYGSTWDVRSVPEAKNVAYTNQFLNFHMDLMYMNEPPGYQLLHCLENSCDGGESLFADSFLAAEFMKKNHRELYEELTQRLLAYEYAHEDQVYYNERPVFEVDQHSQKLRHINYSPPFQAALPTPWKTPGSPVHINRMKQALDVFTKLIESENSVFDLKLNPGECVIFNNRRIVHARRQFNTAVGSRWLAGAYVDTDAVLSRFSVTGRKHLDIWESADPKRGREILKAKKVIESVNQRLAELMSQGAGEVVTKA
ncbi:hypothetical protein N7520_005413 [Penicillium odoratum]|uniref:uncharacterized protein n=1 Tax=Penicillium odoratum TaxID=1167516 RepID=UPI0025474404|nr:uncharacterized protein N7520_005413 [Penicillium odoratum]KAJ5765854.1 hypothetical protein N7520_005413 [Penicillium odoratum]